MLNSALAHACEFPADSEVARCGFFYEGLEVVPFVTMVSGDINFPFVGHCEGGLVVCAAPNTGQ